MGTSAMGMSAMGRVGPFWLPLVLLVPASAAYALGVTRLIRRGDRWPGSRSAAALIGVVFATAAVMPPLTTRMDFVVHVSRHVLLAMVVPLALALSAPVTLALRTLPRRERRMLLRVTHARGVRIVMSAPVVLGLDVGGMYAYYLSPLFAASQAHSWLHLAVDVHMFLAGYVLSAYLVGRDPIGHRPSTRTALIVLVVAAGSHDLMAKLMYARLLPAGGGSPGRIRAGAQLMFYAGDAVDIALACTIMLSWYVRTGRQLARTSRRRPRSLPTPG